MKLIIRTGTARSRQLFFICLRPLDNEFIGTASPFETALTRFADLEITPNILSTKHHKIVTDNTGDNTYATHRSEKFRT